MCFTFKVSRLLNRLRQIWHSNVASRCTNRIWASKLAWLLQTRPHNVQVAGLLLCAAMWAYNRCLCFNLQNRNENISRDKTSISDSLLTMSHICHIELFPKLSFSYGRWSSVLNNRGLSWMVLHISHCDKSGKIFFKKILKIVIYVITVTLTVN